MTTQKLFLRRFPVADGTPEEFHVQRVLNTSCVLPGDLLDKERLAKLLIDNSDMEYEIEVCK